MNYTGDFFNFDFKDVGAAVVGEIVEGEREKKVGDGGSERHYRLEGGVTET
jgi:hypothetical protein